MKSAPPPSPRRLFPCLFVCQGSMFLAHLRIVKKIRFEIRLLINLQFLLRICKRRGTDADKSIFEYRVMNTRRTIRFAKLLYNLKKIFIQRGYFSECFLLYIG